MVIVSHRLADRTVSVPMTLSDFERRKARVIFIKRIAVITLVPFDLFGPLTHVGGTCFCGSATPLNQGGWVAASLKFMGSYL